MKKITLILSVFLFLTSCTQTIKQKRQIEYKYQIKGFVKVKELDHNSNIPKEVLRDAVAYTDTIYGKNEDSIWYYNSDGSKLTLLKPYEIISLK